ncbi:nucleoside hydrolase [Loigolactobacillus bifermentans]|uniref:Ribonucleoside hydrolase 1 n=1 Tax=Loigolactobacillus bifermentans DSM 20003 TaxID=1423726 RepID=A0A0R1H241_9LACO|nr:nucleoside hydrolase [Loigolactobacillus bifermentans]KRK40495.1 ribonucleoside hydrolase 1 [Loigolactobacillus bifermentans DSM 20003]QGG59785.1 pyrimidine-specific ribonucleoside hydrolase RihA [Loigolactobacillus bifermentans]
MTIPIIMDCDPGVDDSIALMMAVAAPEIELLGVTTVAGNQTAAKVLLNARRLLTLLQCHVPVAGGNQTPLLEPMQVAADVHGDSGIGDVVLPEPGWPAATQSATALMAQLITASAVPVTLVATGPQTNVALFLQLYPQLKSKIRQIVFMGGGRGIGNRTPVAEFNIAVDPEAAAMVLQSNIPVVMAGLNVTHQAQVLPTEVQAIRQIGNPVATVAAALLDFYADYYLRPGMPFKGVPTHDPCTIAWLLAPELFTAVPCQIAVETQGRLTRGETVVTTTGITSENEKGKFLAHLDRLGFVQLLQRLLAQF